MELDLEGQNFGEPIKGKVGLIANEQVELA
jgi:hypothetical protein